MSIMRQKQEIDVMEEKNPISMLVLFYVSGTLTLSGDVGGRCFITIIDDIINKRRCVHTERAISCYVAAAVLDEP